MNIINYYTEANIGLVLLFFMYQICLEKETQFSVVRICLLTGISSSLIMPLLHFPTEKTLLHTFLLPEFTTVFFVKSTPERIQSFNLFGAISNIYFIGIVISASFFLFKVSKLIGFLWRAVYQKRNGFNVIEVKGYYSTFSFYNFIVIGNSEKLNEFEKDQIILHESIHFQKWHSFDLLILEFLKIIFWFNPIVYILSKKLIAIHEFQADELSVRNYDSNQYCSLLAKVALMSADIPLANHFSNSLTLKRINMMKTIKTKIKVWKIAAMLPVFALYAITTAAQDNSKTKSKVTLEKSPLNSVEQMPEFIGGKDALTAFLSKEIKYPEKAVKDKTEGKVFVEFVVAKDGTIINPTVVKGITEEINKEAVRVVSSFPKWTAAKNKGESVSVKMILPINFKL